MVYIYNIFLKSFQLALLVEQALQNLLSLAILRQVVFVCYQINQFQL